MQSTYRLMLVWVLALSTLAGTGSTGQAGTERLVGCGPVFSVPSLGLEGQVKRLDSLEEGGVAVYLSLINVSDREVAIPVGEDYGVWQLETESGDRKAYDVEMSQQFTAANNSSSAVIPPNAVRNLVLVFDMQSSDGLTLFNSDLGGDLQREGVIVCNTVVAGDNKPSGEAGADDEVGTATATIQPTATALPTATLAPTATQRATESPTRVPNTPTPNNFTATSTIQTELFNSNWLPAEYPGVYAPTLTFIDCQIPELYGCIEANASWGSIVYQIYNTPAEASIAYRAIGGSPVALYSGRSAKYFDADDADLTFTVSDRVITIGFTQAGTFYEGVFYDRYTMSLELADRGTMRLERVT